MAIEINDEFRKATQEEPFEGFNECNGLRQEIRQLKRDRQYLSERLQNAEKCIEEIKQLIIGRG